MRSDLGGPGSINVLLLGKEGRTAARAFTGPTTICYDFTVGCFMSTSGSRDTGSHEVMHLWMKQNTSMSNKGLSDIRDDIYRLTSKCRAPCEAVIIVEHTERLT